MREVLGIKPIDIKTTLVDMANSFIEFGLVKLEQMNYAQSNEVIKFRILIIFNKEIYLFIPYYLY